MNYDTDCAVMESVFTILSIFKKGIMKDRRQILLKMTNKELKNMLTGMKRISNLNKIQLVDLVLENA